ncbi:hypothetical protein [Mesorhizobium loti]|uniref:Uncharacterized protein n=1 Tax=Rhizobium loti TaxID=381 RepID=A0A1A5Q930_RHILI|nr:hypothetical protein [Mesorhizobium loti]OBP74947.1 hypothetical protein BAE39_31355 [Mesorhizobium loti]OBQ63747.1 hypothetical protein A8145_32710 [Mesorhizobium loti]QKC73241.1 hypothetical protein EB815_32020 [Mesorhizobium loti]
MSEFGGAASGKLRFIDSCGEVNLLIEWLGGEPSVDLATHHRRYDRGAIGGPSLVFNGFRTDAAVIREALEAAAPMAIEAALEAERMQLKSEAGR